jgi:hypothetical protein
MAKTERSDPVHHQRRLGRLAQQRVRPAINGDDERPTRSSIVSGLLLEGISGKSSGNTGLTMSKQARSSLANHRARKARQGFVRVEISVRKEDAGLVRQVAAALSDPARQTAARALLRQRLAEPAGSSLKALLASAPLEGIDLDRSRDPGRDVDL